MEIKSPCIITSRLLPGIKIGDTTISITYSRKQDSLGRVRWETYIDCPNWNYQSDDLLSGHGRHGLQDGLLALVTYLEASAEAYSYTLSTGRKSENYDLFPEVVTEWSYQNHSELTMASIELQEIKDLIVE